MSMIDQLIQMKRAKKDNDIVAMLDEFTLYDKLSDIKALGDIDNSPALQKKLPHLTKLIKGDFYNLSLAIVARDILTHLNYEIPSAIYNHMADIPERTKKRLTLVGDSTVQAEYRELREYHQETNKNKVIGVYTNNVEDSDMVRIIIIVNQRDEIYTIYQGSYEEIDGEVCEKESRMNQQISSYIEKVKHGTIIIPNYSIQGNNSYPFAQYKNQEGFYYISIPDRKHLALSKDAPAYWDVSKGEIIGEVENITLTTKEINKLGIDRQEIERFAQTIARIINRWEDEKWRS